MKNIVYYIAIATVLLFASCASELDTEPSGSQVSDEQLGELIKENADLVLAPMMQGAVNYMHTGNIVAGNPRVVKAMLANMRDELSEALKR